MKAVHEILDPSFPGKGRDGVCALAVMTKAPRAGQVKTRLIPPLKPDEAAQLNACFLRDTATAISRAVESGKKSGTHARGVAIYTPLGSEDAYANILPSDFDLIPQRDGSFGERLYFGAEDLFKCGFGSVCLIDSDSPTVPAECFAEAARVLSKPGDRIALGPSDDGGYYLIGMTQLHRRLFEEIDWSTERVFDQTMARAVLVGVEVKLLPIGYDVDDPAALSRLCSELLAQNTPDGVAPNTRKFLASMVAQNKL